MQVNNYSESSPTFGAYYSKKTIKSLKRIVPDLIRKEGFENTRYAIANLTKLGKRKDGLVVQLVNDGNIYDIGNKTGLYVRPFEDKHEIIVDDILFVLFEKDFERET